MPLNLQGFVGEPNQWAGLYHAADQMEKQKLQANQLAMQKQAKRSSAANFLQKYLDPKDMLSGTNFDPMIIQGLEEGMKQGSQLVAAGADEAMLMTALGPMVNKLTKYSTNAKNVNKQVDERIKGMRDSGLTGYNYAAIKDQALKSAFYKKDAKGQDQLDPDNIDLSQDYVQKAIADNPLETTTDDVFDEFAKKSEKFETLADVTTYTPTGEKTKSRSQLVAADYMVPEVDKHGVTTGFVPKHDIATEQGQPLFHKFNKGGKEVNEPVRLLDEQFFDKGLKPAMQDRIRGMVKAHLDEYSTKSGKKIDINSPEAKYVARAIAYDMLNVDSRKGGSIKEVDIKKQPSNPMINLRVHQLPSYQQTEKETAASRKEGRLSVADPNDPNQYKQNAGQAIGGLFKGTEDLSGMVPDKISGKLFSLDGKTQDVKDYPAIDVTSYMPGGGLHAGRGNNYDYKRVFYNPKDRKLIVEQVETNLSGSKSAKFTEVPEAQVGQFINKIAEANGIPRLGTRKLLDDMGYKDGKFGGNAPAAASTPADDFNKLAKEKKSWRKPVNNFANPFAPK